MILERISSLIAEPDENQQAASAGQMGRFETELLAYGENFAALTEFSDVWIGRVHGYSHLTIIGLFGTMRRKNLPLAAQVG